MVKTNRASFTSKIYEQNSDLPSEHCDTEFLSHFEFASDYITVQTREIKYVQGYDNNHYHYSLTFEVEENGITELLEFLKEDAEPERTGEGKLTLDVKNGSCTNTEFRGSGYESKYSQKEEGFPIIRIFADREKVVFSGFCTNDPIIYYAEKVQRGKDQEHNDRKNLDKIIDLLQGTIKGTSQQLFEIIDEDLQRVLQSTKYGDEVIDHVVDGDELYEHGFYQPSLSSYIHAFEWAMITYLEDKNDIDIIEREKDGELYYFTGGEKNLLDEMKKVSAPINQKMETKIKSLNRVERRWMAHHKSGNTLPSEVLALRERLGHFLTGLFCN